MRVSLGPPHGWFESAPDEWRRNAAYATKPTSGLFGREDRSWFFVWDDIGPHIGWVWRGKAREAARTYQDGWVFD
jgi:hypothetical protein